MHRFNEKLKLIFLPFLLLEICIIGGYTFLNWLLFIKLHVFALNEDILNLWIPLALPWIPILIWLRPRIKLLNLKRKKGDLPSLYIFIAGFAMAIPTLIAQTYLETASGKLTQLDNISQIEKQEATKYYTLKNFYIDKNNICVHSSFNVSGKNNQYFNMNLYITLPVLNSPADTSFSNCVAWYGIKYHKQISNRLDKNEKEERYKSFLNESQSDFDQKDVSKFIYFDRIGRTDDHKEYISAIKRGKKYSTNSATVLIPIDEPFEARNGNKFAWIFGAVGIGSIVWLIILLIPKFDEDGLQKMNSEKSPKETALKEALSILVPRQGFYITPIIMDLNILVFIVMVFSGLGFISFKPDDLIAWGANFKPSTTDGEWWRLLTSTFLHGGFMHLAANMYGLLFVGLFLEPKLGKTRYAVIYLTTGIIASLASLYTHEATVSIGASGAIFGLYGVFLSLLITKVFPKEFSKPFLLSTLIFIGYNILMGFAGSGIDNAAHIGGLASGFIIGLILSPQLKRQAEDEHVLEPVETRDN